MKSDGCKAFLLLSFFSIPAPLIGAGCGAGGEEAATEEETGVLQQALPTGFVEILTQHSLKCLDVDVSSGSLDNGRTLQQWDCWGGANQRFKLR